MPDHFKRRIFFIAEDALSLFGVHKVNNIESIMDTIEIASTDWMSSRKNNVSPVFQSTAEYVREKCNSNILRLSGQCTCILGRASYEYAVPDAIPYLEFVLGSVHFTVFHNGSTSSRV